MSTDRQPSNGPLSDGPGPSPADHELAARLAEEAGRLLLDLRARLQDQNATVDAIKTQGDRRAHEFLVAALRTERPHDGLLSEEFADGEDEGRLEMDRVWIVDPLDGTREYGEGREDWAVHVALVIGGSPLAAAVALPAQGVTFSTLDPPDLPKTADPPRVILSRTRRPPAALAVADALGADLVEMGSAGAKAMAVLQGRAEVYPHAGGQFEWDSAAPVGVARAAGLHCSRLDGTPLLYNRPDPWMPDLLVCREELLPRVLAVTAPYAGPR